MKNSNSISFLMEIFWLVTGIGAFVLAVYQFLSVGLRPASGFFIISFLSFLLFLLRRRLRLKNTLKNHE